VVDIFLFLPCFPWCYRRTTGEQLASLMYAKVNIVLCIQLKTECGSQFTNKLEGMFKVGVSLHREI